MTNLCEVAQLPEVREIIDEIVEDYSLIPYTVKETRTSSRLPLLVEEGTLIDSKYLDVLANLDSMKLRLCMRLAKTLNQRIQNTTLVYDLETTGLDPRSALIQYFFQDFDTEEVVASSFLRPGSNVLMSAQYVEKNGVPYSRAIRDLNRVLSIFDRPTLVCYSAGNPPRDDQWLESNGVCHEHYTTDAYTQIQQTLRSRGYLGPLRLSSIYWHLFGGDLNFHDARDDTYALIRILRQLDINWKTTLRTPRQKSFGKRIVRM